MSFADLLNAPFVWIVLPALAALGLWWVRERRLLVTLLGMSFCLVLALLAWLLPIGQLVHVGPLNFTISDTLDFAGRKLVLESANRAFLTLVYLLCAFWFAGSGAARADRLLIPLGLGIVALLVAAEAVEPFLYAALLVEMAVLLAVPLLAPPGKPFRQGVLRFLIFQTLGMPFLLLAGWALAGVEATPANQTLINLSTVFLGLGFAFWLAVFPFYTWVPLLAEQTYPYVAGFVLLLLPTVHLLLALKFLNQFAWLRALPDLYPVMGQIGALMVVTAGVWAAFQRDLARLMGYAVIVETGFSLLAISLHSHIGSQLFASMFMPRVLALGLWALSLSILLDEAPSTRFTDLQGFLQRMPVASAGLAVASLTLAGLPLLAVFPIRQSLLEELARQNFATAVWALLGTVGMLFSTFRSLAVLARGATLPTVLPRVAINPEDPPPPSASSRVYHENRWQNFLLGAGMLSLLFIGLLPQAFYPLLTGLLAGYPNLP